MFCHSNREALSTCGLKTMSRVHVDKLQYERVELTGVRCPEAGVPRLAVVTPPQGTVSFQLHLWSTTVPKQSQSFMVSSSGESENPCKTCKGTFIPWEEICLYLNLRSCVPPHSHSTFTRKPLFLALWLPSSPSLEILP